MKVLFLIRSLEQGGAERQIVTIARGLSRQGHHVSVAVFYGNGVMEDELRAFDVPVVQLNKKGRWSIIGLLRNLRRCLRNLEPDVLYSCLAGPNICAVLARLMLGRPVCVVFRIAASFVDLDRYDRLTRLAYWMEARLARFADLIVSNSRAGVENIEKWGVSPDRVTLVPNGFDTERFKRDELKRATMREAWDIAPDVYLIGLVARLDPMKDHHNFLRAAEILAKRHDGIKFLCVGGGDETLRADLQSLAAGKGLGEKLLWERESSDMPAVYNALDIATCSSYGEGFPNVVGEAMACETPCVVTDVGDSAWIVGDTGLVVRPREPVLLAEAWMSLLRRLEKEGSKLGREARKRIIDNFGERKLVVDTESSLLRLVGESRAANCSA